MDGLKDVIYPKLQVQRLDPISDFRDANGVSNMPTAVILKEGRLLRVHSTCRVVAIPRTMLAAVLYTQPRCHVTKPFTSVSRSKRE